MILAAQRDVVGTGRPKTMTHATLSRIERGLVPYNQYLLELLAEIYGTDAASLIVRDPSDPEGLWQIVDHLTPAQQQQLVELAKVLHKTSAND